MPIWGIIENDPVIPRGGAILALIWHLFGTDFLSANPSAAYLASATVAPSLALMVEGSVPFEVVGEITETRTTAVGQRIGELRLLRKTYGRTLAKGCIFCRLTRLDGTLSFLRGLISSSDEHRPSRAECGILLAIEIAPREFGRRKFGKELHRPLTV